MNLIKSIILQVFIAATLASCVNTGRRNILNLAGEWSFKADPAGMGITQRWYTGSFEETISLPGSMTENGKGDPVGLNTSWTGDIVDSSWFFEPAMAKYREAGNIKVPFWLQPELHYVGAAWYQRRVNIPGSWNGRYIRLFLERCHWESRVWVDENSAGMQNALGAPHIFDLSQWLTPGWHTLTICVDNRVKDIDVGRNSHSITDHTQTNWNGITGKLELQAMPVLHISNVKLYPDIQHKKVKVSIELRNYSGLASDTEIKLLAEALQEKGKEKFREVVRHLTLEPGNQTFETEYPMGEDPCLWDEFHPCLYLMTIELSDNEGKKDARKISFGMREIKTHGTQIAINGRPVILRGTLECAIFPKTGYPPTDTASWMRIFRIARAHGLNHMRFHSWCPPEAAFEAADQMGFYLHVECSSWANFTSAIGDGKPVDQFIYDESERIVSEYGNHPSFCMMQYGNEPAGINQERWLAEFVRYWKNRDPRRLYSSGAGWPVIPESDYNNIPQPRIQGWGEGLKSIINAQPPRTDYDWKDRIAGYDKPTVSHEIGQWCVYPDLKEISQYDGVLKAKNFEIFKETLEENQLGHLADSFLMASGKLQAICYKADIEAALRTPGFGGFQLLDLHDFPGQGTALVGVLNSFWGEKGYIKPSEYRRFCNATVLLARLPKMIYTSRDTLKAPVEISHFGEKELSGIIPVWKLLDSEGKVLAGGKIAGTSVPFGNGIRLGEIIQPLAGFSCPAKIILTLAAEGSENSWDLWIYPDELPAAGNDVLVTQKLDARALSILREGGKVLLTPKKGSVKPEKGGDIAVGFSSIFWNTAWTAKQAPHTMGILCNPKHPALADFPTEYHSNWQWWDAMSHANAMIISDLPAELTPIVRIIDDWFTNRPLALIFEAKIGAGKIIVSGADLLTDIDKRPEARQLMYSLQHYMAGPSYDPAVKIDPETLRCLFN
jgi:hypothetical protein